MLLKNINNKNTALLIIDIINSCSHKKCENKEWNIAFSKIRKMAVRLDKFIKNYRLKFKGKIIFIKTVPWQKRFLPENINNFYKDPAICYYTKDQSGKAEEFFLLKPEKRDKIIEKNTYDAFASKELVNFAKKNKIKNFIVTGVFTEGCVLATVAGGFSRGYNFILLRDLIETADHPDRQNLQQKLFRIVFPLLYGKVFDSKVFLNKNNS